MRTCPGGSALLGSAALLGTGKNAKPEAAFAFALAGFIAFGIGAAAFAIARMCPGKIMLESRDAVPGWFKRNRDGLSVQVIGGAVVLFIGIGIGLWIK